MIQIRISRFALLAAALVLASATHAGAQRRAQPLALDSLSHVRVTQTAVDPERFRATFLSADSQAIVVRRGDQRLALPRRSVLQLEASRGSRTVEGGAWRGAKRGFLGGAVLGAALGLVILATGEDDTYISNEAGATIVLGMGITVGTVLGTVFGAAAPGEEWVPVPVPGQP
ncbi:MAG TPA: hypothetical protein VFR81_24250 [Longimicrobium sp.]|nr:hypothetical protein [Longimicrobium sp.]